MGLVNAIINKLKTGSIPEVVLFSDVDTFPAPPYVVVKPEFGTVPDTRQFRIIAHAEQGQFDKLENYCLAELDRLLLGDIRDEEGSRYTLYTNGFTDITPEPADDTYFMEKLYYVPLRSGG
jgi:hypothetical protein